MLRGRSVMLIQTRKVGLLLLYGIMIYAAIVVDMMSMRTGREHDRKNGQLPRGVS